MPFKDHNSSGKTPFITLIIILVNIVVFLYQFSLNEDGLNNFIQSYTIVPSTINFAHIPSLLPFITSMFLHAGLLHLASNMIFLWVFGDNIEAAMGKLKFITFFVIGGVLASLGQYYFIRESSIPLVGASGAIAAVLGAYFVLYPKSRVDVIVPIFFIPTIIAVPAAFILVYWFIIQFISGLLSVTGQTSSLGGVAFIAHVAGFISGMLLIRFFVSKSHVANNTQIG